MPTDHINNSLKNFLTMSPTLATIFVVIGVVMVISAIIMFISVVLGKKLKKPRAPEQWSRPELFIMSMFLQSWALWATFNPGPTKGESTFSEKDCLVNAFEKFVKALEADGTIDKGIDSRGLMEDLIKHNGLSLAMPFGVDGRFKSGNPKRILFADEQGRALRKLFLED